MQRLYRLIALLAVSLLGLAACGSGSRAFVWQRIDTEVQVRADGTLGVTEILTLRYTGGPFTFAFRDLPSRRLDTISNISVGDAERVFTQVSDHTSEQPYTFSVSEEDGTRRVRWVYPATTGSERTFMLRYDVAGAIRRYDTADELWWSVAFPDRSEVVEQARGRITFPTPIPADQLDASAPDASGTIERSPGAVTVQGANIPANRELTLRVRFPKNSVGGGAPAWQVGAAAQEAYDISTRPTVNVVLSAVAAALLVLLAGLIGSWWWRNRDPQPTDVLIGEYPALPEALAPAPAAKLLGQGAGPALLGTLLDLARRGYLTLRETRTGWRNHKIMLTITRTDVLADDLAPYEAATLRALELTERGSEARLSDQHSSILKALPKLDKVYQDELFRRGYVDMAGQARRVGGIVAGTVLLVVGGLAFIPAAILASRYSWWLPVVAGVIGLAGMIWLILGSAVRGVTPAGANALARWRGFHAYLKRVQPASAVAGQFDTLLPYAAAFGAAHRLAKAYSQIDEPLPFWFYPVIPQHGGMSHAAGAGQNMLLLSDFSQNFLAAMTGVSSSVGAGGASGGGGGGASGGGGGGAG